MTFYSPDITKVGSRQFIVADRPHCATQGWIVTELGDNVFLSHCPRLRVVEQHDLDGCRWALIGNAFQSLASAPLPQDAIGALRTTEVFDQTFTWSGRWVLVSSRQVLTDVGALLPVFYPLRDDGGVHCSSSLAILAAFHPELPRCRRRLGWCGMNWYPAPSTQLSGIRRLLPRQVLDIPERRASYIRRLKLEEYANFDLSSAAGIFAEALQVVLRGMADDGPLTLALTSGLDSRTTLACLAATGLDFTAYTQVHPFISRADLELPPQLAGFCGKSHTLIKAKARSKEREERYDLHTYGNAFDADRYFHSRAMYDELRDLRMIRSSCYELGRRFYEARLGNLSLAEVIQAPERISRHLRTFAGAGETAEALHHWLLWAERETLEVGWQDLFYWEQRLAVWLADVEHSLDLNEALSFQPVNGALFYSLLLLNSDHQGSLQRQIIESRLAGLLAFPINPGLESRRAAFRVKAAQLLTCLCHEARNAARVAGAGSRRQQAILVN